MAINGTTWHKRQSIRFSCCGEACWGGYDPGYYASKNCNQHIYWPTLWGTVQGTAYDESENPIETGAEIRLNAWIDSDYQGGYVNAVIPSANGVYGPVSIPVGSDVTISYDLNEKKGETYVLALYDGQEIFSDFGPRASGTVEGYVYDDGGNPVSGVKVKSIYMATTDASGFYRMNDVGMGPFYSFYTFDNN